MIGHERHARSKEKIILSDARRANVVQIVEQGWNAVRPERQFWKARASGDVVNQAKEILIERYGVTPEAAFALLKRLSDESGVPVVEVSHRLVEDESSKGRTDTSDPDPALRRRVVREGTRC